MNKNTSLKRRTGEFRMYANTPEGYPLPIEFSMPFPQGHLWDIRNLRILCKETENPSQYRILNYWPDGSIKWVQGVARVSGEFQVLYNQGTSQTLPPIQVLQDGVNVLLKNEDTKLMIDTRNGTATFYKGKRVLSFHLSRLITPNGEEFYAKEAKVQVLEEGPIRSKVRLQGYHIDDNGEGFLKFDIFISLYSGVPIIEITHVLGVTHKDNSVNP